MFPLFLLGLGIVLLAFLALVGRWHQESTESWVKLLFSLRDPCLSCSHARETSVVVFLVFSGVRGNRDVPYTFAKKRRSSLFSDDTCKVLKLRRAKGGNNGQTKHETSFPSPTSPWEIRGCLSKSDFITTVLRESALATFERWVQTSWTLWGYCYWSGSPERWTSDFLAVSQQRLFPARVRAEWPNLRRKGIHSGWAPACQDGAHVGHAGFGVVFLNFDPVAMPSFATTAFRRFFDLGRLVRYVLPLGNGRLMHW